MWGIFFNWLFLAALFSVFGGFAVGATVATVILIAVTLFAVSERGIEIVKDKLKGNK